MDQRKNFTQESVQHRCATFASDTSYSMRAEYAPVNLSWMGKGATNFPFPTKLFDMLEQVSHQDGLVNIVSWQPHGRSFLVHDQQEFVDRIMPRYFRQSKFASFQRQLNLYGFNRLTSGRDKGAYYHVYFLRGKRFLANRIHRNKIKGTGARKASSPASEPQFYNMEPVEESNEEHSIDRSGSGSKFGPFQQGGPNAAIWDQLLPQPCGQIPPGINSHHLLNMTGTTPQVVPYHSQVSQAVSTNTMDQGDLIQQQAFAAQLHAYRANVLQGAQLATYEQTQAVIRMSLPTAMPIHQSLAQPSLHHSALGLGKPFVVVPAQSNVVNSLSARPAQIVSPILRHQANQEESDDEEFNEILGTLSESPTQDLYRIL